MTRRARLALAIALTAAGPPACAPPPETARNLVLVSIDTLSALHVGAYGYERDTTPTLDAIAEEGTLFEHAYTPQPWTLTAHLSMLTGLYPDVHGAGKGRAVRRDAPTLAEWLGDRGFETAAWVDRTIWLQRRFGLARGFRRYRMKHAKDTPDDAIWRGLHRLARQQEVSPDHRFFLFVHWYDPHSDEDTEVPYWAPEPWNLRYLGGELDWNRRGDTRLLLRLQESGDATARDREVLTALYDGGIRYVDEVRLGALHRLLGELGLAEDTLLVVTSDHGEEILQHGRVGHQQPYEHTARVPLVMRGPGIPAGRRVETEVDLVDLMPTVLARLGVEAPARLQGRDLSPLLSGGSVPPRPTFFDGIHGASEPFFAHKPSGVVRREDGARWSYVTRVEQHVEDGRRSIAPGEGGELYRLDEDPAQRHDLATRHPERAAALERELLAWYRENLARDPHAAGLEDAAAAAGAAVEIDAAEEAQLEALGYVR